MGTESKIKLGVFTVSMPDYEPMQALEIAKELGYDGVEWRVTTDKGDKAKPSFWSGNRTTMTAEAVLAQADALKEKAAALGLEMPSLGTYIGCENPDAVDLHMRAAVALGAKSLRIGPGKYSADAGPYPAQLAQAQAHYAKVAELAGKHGVRALIETHMGLLTPTVAKTMNVLQGLSPEQVGIMWDPGNQVKEGSELYDMAIEIAGEYLAEVHVKNMTWVAKGEERGQTIWQTAATPVGKGVVNWPAVVDSLKAHGYEGWLFFEDFSTDVPLYERLKQNVAWFRELV
ncbi:MAG: sugar phosphate isomerase/epimerase [Kiritimatiellae bacterium]|nr:sugar phosphate isomerase/epimerase [Kiritimatiellia bacterium]